MKGRLLALPTLLLVLAGVIQATRTLEGGRETGSIGGHKLAEADRVVVYEVTEAGGPRFRLPGGPEEIHLFVHLDLPRALTTAAPSGVYRFGVTATLRGADGAPMWERTLTQRTRQTKAERSGDGWDYEAAFVPGGRLELSDSVSLEITVPPAPVGSVLELRLAGGAGLLAEDGTRVIAPIVDATALVRAYRQIAVDPAQAELRRLALVADAGARRLAAATYLPWYALSEGQQRQRLALAWQRLAAEGRAGVDYEVHSIYLAPPRVPVAPLPPEPALTIARGQPIVMQLVGPGVLDLSAWPLAGLPEEEGGVELRLRRLSDAPSSASLAAHVDVTTDRPEAPVPKDSSIRPIRPISPISPISAIRPISSISPISAADSDQAMVRMLPLRAGEVLREPLSIGPGWWSLEIHTALPGVSLQVRADVGERHAGPDDHTQHRGHDGHAFIPVDLRVLPVYATGPQISALPIAIAENGDVDARLVQLDVRALAELVPVPIHYSFLDAEGKELATGASVADTTEPAPFERLRRSGEVIGDVPEDRQLALEGSEIAELLSARATGPAARVEALGFSLADAPVSEPVTLRLLAPAGARSVRISTEAPALVAVHGRLPDINRESGPRWTWPYDQVEDGLLRWRYAPRVASRAFPRRTEDHVARVAAGHVMLIQAQVRAEAVEITEETVPGWRTETPRGAHPRLRLLERVQPGHRRNALGDWGAGNYLRLKRDTPVAIDLGSGGPLGAKAWFKTTGPGTAVVGKEMALAVGDQVLRWTITAREGRKPLPGRGVAEVRWLEGPAESMILVDRPPAPGSNAALYENRQVHRLGAGGGLAVALDKSGVEPVVLNLTLYWLAGAPTEATALDIEIDDGAPLRREGALVSNLTPGNRSVQVLPVRRTEVILPDRRGLSSAGLARIAVVLGDDLAPGRHTVRVRPHSGPPVWVRFFRAGRAPESSAALQWNRRSDSVTLEDSDDGEE